MSKCKKVKPLKGLGTLMEEVLYNPSNHPILHAALNGKLAQEKSEDAADKIQSKTATGWWKNQIASGTTEPLYFSPIIENTCVTYAPEPTPIKQPQTMEELYKGTIFDENSPNYQKPQKSKIATKYGNFNIEYNPTTTLPPTALGIPVDATSYYTKYIPGAGIPNKNGIIKSIKEDDE